MKHLDMERGQKICISVSRSRFAPAPARPLRSSPCSCPSSVWPGTWKVAPSRNLLEWREDCPGHEVPHRLHIHCAPAQELLDWCFHLHIWWTNCMTTSGCHRKTD